MTVSNFSTTASNNTAINGVNISEGMSPSDVNNALREFAKDIRTVWNDKEWFLLGDADGATTFTRASASSVTISSNITSAYHVGRRVKVIGSNTGTIFGKIATSSFSSPNTTLAFTFDSGSISSGDSTVAVYVGSVFTNPANPVVDEDNMASDSAVLPPSQQSTKAFVTSGSVTLSNKSIALGSNTISGTTAQFNSALSDGSFATLAGSESLTNKTLTSPVLNTAISGTAFLDEDDFASDSATKVASQQSIKAFVENKLTQEDLDISDGSSAIAIDLDSETLGLLGGTGIDSTASGNNVTFAIDSTVATKTGTETFTNKTLTSPVISSISNTGTLTLPTSTDTLVGRATTDTLTNKTVTGSKLKGTTQIEIGDTLQFLDGDLDFSGGTIKLDGSSPKGGNFNTAFGQDALEAMPTTGSGTNNNNTAIGYATLRNTQNGGQNTAIGTLALNSLTGTAGNNTAVGYEAGKFISSGQDNTILGSFDGNESSLDIRTSSGNVVIADGNGNIRFYANSSGNVGIGTVSPSTKLDVDGNITANNIGTISSQASNNVAITGGSITGIVTPSNNSDVAIKSYVDELVAGLRTRIIAEVATTANVNLSNGLEAGDTIDGVTLVAGDRVLVKDQSTATENGLYLAVSSGAASRDPQYDTIAELSGGLIVVNQGSTNDNKIFLCTTDSDGSLGSTNITYTQVTPSNTGTVTSIGITQSGSEFSISGSPVTSAGNITLDVNRISATKIGANTNVSDTEFGYLANVSSDIQTQINNKAGAGFAVAMAIAL